MNAPTIWIIFPLAIGMLLLFINNQRVLSLMGGVTGLLRPRLGLGACRDRRREPPVDDAHVAVAAQDVLEDAALAYAKQRVARPTGRG